jgi:protein-tyrosine phosphatase
MICTVYWVNDTHAGHIGMMPRPRGGDWLSDEIKSLATQGVDVIVSLLTHEEILELELTKEGELCIENGIEFLSFPINDRDVPPLDSSLKNFIRSLRDRVSIGKSVVIHCRAGIGRSAIIAACLMVSPSNPVERVMSSLAHARGLPVPDTDEQLEWVQEFAAWRTKGAQ